VRKEKKEGKRGRGKLSLVCFQFRGEGGERGERRKHSLVEAMRDLRRKA